MNSSEGTLAAAPPHTTRRPRPYAGRWAAVRIWPEPLALALLAGLLNLWDLSRNSWANTYYAGAVRSMSKSWHNFLFASFDPSGVMSVDKPPLALWVQTASVKIFGFHPLALLAPQALMGVASVLLVYDLTRRRFGRLAGFLAGLVLALTPIAVAISRHNNPDALLILCSVAALWCALRALDDGRTRWLVLAGICVGLGFETKMLVALTVIPGIAAAWIWIAPRGRVRALRQLLAGSGAMLLVAGAWPALVELTPATSRPWVSGTADNRVLSLIFGYNGLGRLEGQSGGPQALGGSNLFGGTPGPLRLLNAALGGQAGWLLGFAAVSALAILSACRLRRSDPRSGWLLLVGSALLTTAVVFSFAHGIFHPYYVSLLAPFSAALVGAGVAQLSGRVVNTAGAAPPLARSSHTGATAPPAEHSANAASAAPPTTRRLRTDLRSGLPAAFALAAGIATELAVLHDYPTELRWLTPTLIVLGAPAAALLALSAPRLRRAALLGALALLLIAPATWAFQTLGHAASGTFPAGGPATGPASGLAGSRPSGGPSAAPRPGLAAAQPSAGVAGGGPGVGFSPPPGAAQGVPSGGPPPLFGRPTTSSKSGSSVFAGGGVFAGNSQLLTQAVRYAATHGGGTVAVASQSEAASLAITGARVAGIGGFSGRESEVSAAWLAHEVRTRHIRWVLTSSNGPGGGNPIGGKPGRNASGGNPGGGNPSGGNPSGGNPSGGNPSGGNPGGGASPSNGVPGGRDQRVGASRAMSAVASACREVRGVTGLYDCAGRASRLAG